MAVDLNGPLNTFSQARVWIFLPPLAAGNWVKLALTATDYGAADLLLDVVRDGAVIGEFLLEGIAVVELCGLTDGDHGVEAIDFGIDKLNADQLVFGSGGEEVEVVFGTIDVDIGHMGSLCFL